MITYPAKRKMKSKPHAPKKKAKKPAPACKDLLPMLEELGEGKNVAMEEVHEHLTEMQEVIDEAIEHAKGDLKKALTVLRKSLF